MTQCTECKLFKRYQKLIPYRKKWYKDNKDKQKQYNQRWLLNRISETHRKNG